MEAGLASVRRNTPPVQSGVAAEGLGYADIVLAAAACALALYWATSPSRGLPEAALPDLAATECAPADDDTASAWRAEALGLLGDPETRRVFTRSYSGDGAGWIYWFAVDSGRTKCGETSDLARRMTSHRLCHGPDIEPHSLAVPHRRKQLERLVHRDLASRKLLAPPVACPHHIAHHDPRGAAAAASSAAAVAPTPVFHREVFFASGALVARRARFWLWALSDSRLSASARKLPANPSASKRLPR
jgi:hypothetical protein